MVMSIIASAFVWNQIFFAAASIAIDNAALQNNADGAYSYEHGQDVLYYYPKYEYVVWANVKVSWFTL